MADKPHSHQDPSEKNSLKELLNGENVQHIPEHDSNNPSSQLAPIPNTSDERDVRNEVNNLRILENETPSTSCIQLDPTSQSNLVTPASNILRLHSLLHTNVPLRNTFTLPTIEAWIEQLEQTQGTTYKTISYHLPETVTSKTYGTRQSAILSTLLQKQLGIDATPEKMSSSPLEFTQPSGNRGDVRLRNPHVVNTTTQLLTELTQVYTTTQTTANSEKLLTELSSPHIIRTSTSTPRSFTSTLYSGVRPRMLYPNNFSPQRCVPYVLPSVAKKYITKTEKINSNHPVESTVGLPELPDHLLSISHSVVEEQPHDSIETVEDDFEKWNTENLQLLAEVAGTYGNTVDRNNPSQNSNIETPISRVITTTRDVATQSTEISQPESIDTSKGAIPKRYVQNRSSLPKMEQIQNPRKETLKETATIEENRSAQGSLEFSDVFIINDNRTPAAQVEFSRPSRNTPLDILASVLEQREIISDLHRSNVNEEPSTCRGAVPKKSKQSLTTTVHNGQGRVSLGDSIPINVTHSTGTVSQFELKNIHTLPRLSLSSNIHPSSTPTMSTTSQQRINETPTTEVITPTRDRVPLRNPSTLFPPSNIQDITSLSHSDLQSKVSQGAIPKIRSIDSVPNTYARRCTRRKKNIKGLQRKPSSTFTQNQLDEDEESNTKSGSLSPPPPINLFGNINQDHQSNQSSGYPMMHSHSCCSKHADQLSSSVLLAKHLPAMSLAERMHKFLTDVCINTKEDEEEVEEDDTESGSN